MSKSLPIVFIVCMLSLQACGSNESKKETSKEQAQRKSFSEATFLDITPLADGGAYAYGLGGDLWYLRGSEAVKVKEVSQLSTQPTSLLSTKRERALWALLQRERSRRKNAESDRENYSDNSDYSEQDQY
ncbi:MAG: hypothetical protein WBW16_11025 [Bacteroidota bacterium]